MGTGSIDIEKTKDLHIATGGIVWRLERTLGGEHVTPPSAYWVSALEHLLLEAHAYGPDAVKDVLSTHRPDLMAWLSALPSVERDSALCRLWAKPDPAGDPSVVPPAP